MAISRDVRPIAELVTRLIKQVAFHVTEQMLILDFGAMLGLTPATPLIVWVLEPRVYWQRDTEGHRSVVVMFRVHVNEWKLHCHAIFPPTHPRCAFFANMTDESDSPKWNTDSLLDHLRKRIEAEIRLMRPSVRFRGPLDFTTIHWPTWTFRDPLDPAYTPPMSNVIQPIEVFIPLSID